MAATVTVQKSSVPGDARFAVVTVQGDASYPTGGYVIDLNVVGTPTKRYGVFTDQGNAVAGVAYALWDDVNKKVKLFSALAVEVVNTTNVATYVVNLLFIGY